MSGAPTGTRCLVPKPTAGRAMVLLTIGMRTAHTAHLSVFACHRHTSRQRSSHSPVRCGALQVLRGTARAAQPAPAVDAVELPTSLW